MRVPEHVNHVHSREIQVHVYHTEYPGRLSTTADTIAFNIPAHAVAWCEQVTYTEDQVVEDDEPEEVVTEVPVDDSAGAKTAEGVYGARWGKGFQRDIGCCGTPGCARYSLKGRLVVSFRKVPDKAARWVLTHRAVLIYVFVCFSRQSRPRTAIICTIVAGRSLFRTS